MPKLWVWLDNMARLGLGTFRWLTISSMACRISDRLLLVSASLTYIVPVLSVMSSKLCFDILRSKSEILEVAVAHRMHASDQCNGSRISESWSGNRLLNGERLCTPTSAASASWSSGDMKLNGITPSAASREWIRNLPGALRVVPTVCSSCSHCWPRTDIYNNNKIRIAIASALDRS